MRESLRTPDVVVFDDVLEPGQFEQVWRFVQLDTYDSPHVGGWKKSWALDDGDVRIGSLHYSARPEVGADVPGHVYPSGIAMDLVIDAVRRGAQRATELIGEQGIGWNLFNARVYLYPPGAGLKWHHDGIYSGGFAFYAHPTWNVQWGGELLVAEGSSRGWSPPTVPVMGAGPRSLPTNLDNTALSETLLRAGHGVFLAARPNRLVIIRPGSYHTILPVRAAAGNHTRCSIAGFFDRLQDAAG